MTARISDQLSFTHGQPMAHRMMLAPLTNMQSHDDGTLGEDEYRWLTMRAEGGMALTMTCAAFVQAGGKAFPGQLGISSDDHLPGLTRLAAAIKAAGSLSSVQLHHGGIRAEHRLDGADKVGPYDDEKSGARAMTTTEVEESIAAFIAAAVRAERAGFDGVEVHGAHGYLLCDFLNEGRNLRTDGFGSDATGRTRMIREIVSGIRAATGPDFQLGLRLSPERFGVTLSESLPFAQEMMASGELDYLDMSLWDCFGEATSPGYEGKTLIDLFTALPRGECRLGVAGKIMSAATVQICLDHGADFVLIGRGAMVHHDFARAALADPVFETAPFPLPRAHFEREGLGTAFLVYVASNWPGYMEG